MLVSSLTILDLLNNKLLEFPALVDSLKNKEVQYLSSLERWMKETEDILKKNRISECALIAGYRSKIIAPMFADGKLRSTRKNQWQQASALMFDLQESILTVMRPYEVKVSEARDLVLQLMSILKQSNALQYSDGVNFQDFVQRIWQLCYNHEQLKQYTVKIASLVSQNDIFRIIAEEINLTEWR